MGLFMCLEYMRGAERGSSPRVPLTLSPCPSSRSTWNIGRGLKHTACYVDQGRSMGLQWTSNRRQGAWAQPSPTSDST